MLRPGIANIVIRPDLFAAERVVIVSEPFLLVEGVLQNQQGTVSVRAVEIRALALATAAVEARDFH
jgi:error-prone DNA polymerase